MTNSKIVYAHQGAANEYSDVTMIRARIFILKYFESH